MKHIKRFDEVIKVDIKVGDTVLGGRFKNKKTVVKKIGKNKKGDITINGKPLLKYRIIKEEINVDDVLEYYLSHLIDEGFMVQGDKGYIRIFKPKHGDFYSYTNLIEFNFSDVAGDVVRFVNSVNEVSRISYMVLADTPKEYETDGGLKLIDNLERKIISLDDIDEANMDMYSLTISF